MGRGRRVDSAGRRKNGAGRVSGFFSEVYRIVAEIPEGKVATYGQIAAMLGHPRGARTVGWAMRQAPSGANLPCHRVVNKKGEMSPDWVFGGAEVQRAELEAEGVNFRADGRVDMAASLWCPERTYLERRSE
jgi:methylated-DNA-protein-cysteine methyltransferase-like protein